MVAFINPSQVLPGYVYGEESSRPIGPIPADQSKATAIKGAGQFLESGVKVANQFVEQSILSKEHQGLDEINDQAIKRLTEAKANPALIDQEENRQPPEAVKGLPKDLDRLDQARANNKISQTYIDGQKDLLAKDLRATYPGWRDFIDESFAKSNREDPANRYIGSMVGDINSMAAARKAARDETGSLVKMGIEKGFDGFDELANGWHAGKVSDYQIRSEFYKFSHREYLRKQALENIAFGEKNEKDAAMHADNIATERVNMSTANWYESHRMASGKTEQEVMDYLGQHPEDSETAQRLASQIQQDEAKAVIQFTKDMSERADNNNPASPSLRTAMGEPKFQEHIKGIHEQFNLALQSLVNKEGGTVHQASNLTRAAMDQTLWGMMYSDKPEMKNFTNWMRTIGVLKKEFPTLEDKIFTDQGLISSGYSMGGLSKDLGNYVKGMSTQIITQPTPDKPATVTKGVSDINAAPTTPEQKVEAAKKIIDNTTSALATNANKDAKSKVVQGLYGPGNENFISFFTPSSQGQAIELMANDQIADHIHKIGGSSWNIYSDWVHLTFENQTRREIGKLNDYASIPGYAIHWDNESHQIVDNFSLQAIPTGRKGTSRQMAASVNKFTQEHDAYAVHDSVERLNSALRALRSVSKYETIDIDATLLSILNNSGLIGLSADLKAALIAANRKIARPTE